jgi:TolB protein
MTCKRGSALAAAVGTVVLLAAPASASAAFPGPNGLIAFDRDDEIFTMHGEGKGVERLTDNAVDDRNPVFSANSERIVFQRSDGADDEIVVMRANGHHKTPLTDNDAGDFEPTWSPNGERIAFESNRVTAGNPTGDSEIWVMRKNGSDVEQLTDNAVNDNDPDWSPNGNKIAFSREDTDIIVMRAADGRKKKNLTDNGFSEDDPDFSPNGKRIVYQTFRGGDSEIFTVPVAGGHERRVTKNHADDYEPAYSPSGDAIVFVSGDDILRMTAKGKGRHRITDNDKSEESPDWGAG